MGNKYEFRCEQRGKNPSNKFVVYLVCLSTTGFCHSSISYCHTLHPDLIHFTIIIGGALEKLLQVEA